MPNFFGFFSYIFLTAFTPGPNNFMSMSNAARYGFVKSLRFNVGIFAGFMLVLSICAGFSSALFAALPAIKPYLKVVGAGYILWLAFHVLKSTYDYSGDTVATNTFTAGMLLQFINPKLYLYGITSLSVYVLPYYSQVYILALFILLLSAMGFVCTVIWSLFGSLFQKFLRNHTKAANLGMSLLLVYCAVALFF